MTKSLKIAVATALCAVGTQARSAEWIQIGKNVKGDFAVSVKKDTLKVTIVDKQPYTTVIARFLYSDDDKVYFYELSLPGSVCDAGVGRMTITSISDGKSVKYAVVLDGGNLTAHTAEYMCEFFNRQREGDSL